MRATRECRESSSLLKVSREQIYNLQISLHSHVSPNFLHVQSRDHFFLDLRLVAIDEEHHRTQEKQNLKRKND